MSIKPYKIENLLQIMSALRRPGTGCPWDIKQSFETIAPYTLEEAYEVVDAIDKGNLKDLQDELGDLLFQVVYHAQMADEAKAFDFNDVLENICKKLIRRHPHVFNDEQVEEKDLAKEWERYKRVEKNEAEESSQNTKNILDDVPLTLPAMRRAYKLQTKAASVNFDWDDVGPVVAKLDEEVAELKAELKQIKNKQRIKEELGDVLFSCVNLARHLDLDAEGALRSANQRFYERFCYIENKLKSENRTLEGSDNEELECMWEDAKKIVFRNNK